MNNFFDLDANIFGYSPLKKNTDKRNLSNSCPQMKSFDSGTFQKKIKWESSSIRKPQNDLSGLLFRGSNIFFFIGHNNEKKKDEMIINFLYRNFM